MVEPQPRRLDDFEPLSVAERRTLQELDTGRPIMFGKGLDLPGADTSNDRRLRARFIRWLALGCEGSGYRLHESGLRILGALIVSDGPQEVEARGLDLTGCRLEHDLGLRNCRFEAAPLLRGANVRSLFFDGSILPGLNADSLVAAGGVHMRGTMNTGGVRLVNARIAGNLEFDGAKLLNTASDALNADGARIDGGLYLRVTTATGIPLRTIATGKVRLVGARIGASIECHGAKLSNAGGIALSAERTRTDGDVVLQGADITGEVQLSGARIGGDLNCRGANLSNSGGNAPWAAGADRLRWLGLQEPSKFRQDFWPQPYEQCAKVLREMGHPEDAREILIEKERLQRQARRRLLRQSGGRRARLLAAGRGLWDGVLGVVVGYGQRSMRAFAWLAGLWLVGLGLYFGAWQAEVFKPNNPFVLRAPEWVLCAAEAPAGVYLPSMQRIGRGRAAAGQGQLDCFLGQPEARSFPEFSAGIYSFDVLFPLVDVAQQAHWVPDTRTWPGLAAKLYHYVQIILGWALSLLAVAGFSGLVKSD